MKIQFLPVFIAVSVIAGITAQTYSPAKSLVTASIEGVLRETAGNSGGTVASAIGGAAGAYPELLSRVVGEYYLQVAAALHTVEGQ